MAGIHRLGQRGPVKSKPIRNPIAEPDLLRLIDTMIFMEQLQKLTPQELKEARSASMYKMLMRMGREAYRAGEIGLRPRPTLMAVHDAPDEQVTPTEARPQPAEPTRGVPCDIPGQ